MSTLAQVMAHAQRATPYSLIQVGVGGITTADFLTMPQAERMRANSAALYRTTAPTIIGPAMLVALEGAIIDAAAAAHLVSRHIPDLSRARHLIANHYGQGVAFPADTPLHADALGAQLTTRLTHSITLLSEFVGVPSRSLWPAAVDRVVGALLNAGGAVGWPPDKLLTEIAGVRAGTPLDTPYTGVYDINGRLHLRRAACCHVDRSGAPLCDNCPQRPEAERQAALRA